ncbi:coagulation factor XIII B chain-like [Hemicordylus capensis]|uniref:coagulation factor XIII B chain-like n=1 Tax=Hemicordylus capensis TaxID=884348 RepID=UPI00230425D4|nr:coagulation factor XIII B chain-like [Hemicordylus capensis]XP_053098974.1 coagulation factor XIII B chain-like [Hemicordylus capensis]
MEFLCRKGYVLTTPSVAKCVDGHINLPSCISERGMNCSLPPTIRNGDIITLNQKQYTAGSWVEFKCQRDYAMEGHNRSFCDNGNWTKVPVCLEPCTISMADIESQKLEVKGSPPETTSANLYLPRGDSVELGCKSGYVPATHLSQSAFIIQCNGGSVLYPECKEIVCSLPEVGNGRFHPQQDQYRYEDTVEIQCDRGYRLEHGADNSTCTENGWSPSPRCVPKPCDYVKIANGRLSSDYGGRYFPKRLGGTIYFRCNDGFLPAGGSDGYGWILSTCTKLGWDPEPECLKTCRVTRTDVPHGRFIQPYHRQNQPYREGEEISFSCYEGYYPENPEAKARCTKNGWTPTPRCAETPACKLVDPPHGYFYERQRKFALNERATYGCESGYTTPQGLERQETKCLEEGWTPEPKCIINRQAQPGGNTRRMWRTHTRQQHSTSGAARLGMLLLPPPSPHSFEE